MGNRATIALAVQKAIKDLGDIAERSTYLQTRLGSYDAESGSGSSSVRKFPVVAVFLDTNDEHLTIDGVQQGDMRMVFAARGLQFKPQTNDNIIRGKDEYEVTAISRDPIDATYTLFLRKR